MKENNSLFKFKKLEPKKFHGFEITDEKQYIYLVQDADIKYQPKFFHIIKDSKNVSLHLGIRVITGFIREDNNGNRVYVYENNYTRSHTNYDKLKQEVISMILAASDYKKDNYLNDNSGISYNTTI
jgi:hypothetical protein